MGLGRCYISRGTDEHKVASILMHPSPRTIEQQQRSEELVMKGSICHVEIPADNLSALQKFYGGIFEWEFEKVPGDIEYYGVKQGDNKPTAGMMPRHNWRGARDTRFECRSIYLLREGPHNEDTLLQKHGALH
jgi:hypothetical protein